MATPPDDHTKEAACLESFDSVLERQNLLLADLDKFFVETIQSEEKKAAIVQ
jgi:hypothetical protein